MFLAKDQPSLHLVHHSTLEYRVLLVVMLLYYRVALMSQVISLPKCSIYRRSSCSHDYHFLCRPCAYIL